MVVADPVGATTSRLITGLVNGTPVHLRVSAVNAVGAGVASNMALAIPRTVPSAPRTLTATPLAAGQIRLSWQIPSSTGGAVISDYVIQRSSNGVTWTPITDPVSTTRTSTVTGLSTTTPTYFRVFAKNVAGPSTSASDIANAIARVVPSAPRNLAAAAGVGRVTLSWAAPTSTGGAPITGYRIERSLNGTAWAVVSDTTSTATTFVVTGLSNATPYHFRVFAKNAAGRSVASDVRLATPRTIASAPQSLTALPAASGQIRLSWAVPLSTGGATVTDYIVQRSPSTTGTWATVVDGVSPGRTYTVGGLTNGVRYYFRVLAKNAAGTGPASNVANAVPRTVPSAPTSVRAARGSFSVTITWGTPGSIGGAAVTRYSLERATSSGGPWVAVNSSIGPTIRSYTVTGLSYGTPYHFRVAASNAAGRGAWSATVSAVPTAPGTSCHPSYPTVCIPWNGSDLDCGQIAFRRFAVITPPAPYGRDPHGFDADRDGIGCES